MHLPVKKTLIYVAHTFIGIGFGFLAFAGILAIYPSIPAAIAAFIVAGIVEGDVFGKFAWQGFKRLFVIGKEERQREGMPPDYLLAFMLITIMLASISTALSIAFEAHGAMLAIGAFFGIGIPAGIATGGVAIIAVITTFAFAFALYKTFMELWDRVKEHKIIEKIKDYFKDKKSWVKVALGIITGIVALLIIITTIASAGTWWHAVKAGALLLPHIGKLAAIIRSVTVPFFVISSLSFLVNNSIDTIRKFGNLFNSLKSIKEYRDDAWKAVKANPNPIYWCTKLLVKSVGAIIFVGHSVCCAAMFDRVGGRAVAIGATCAGAVADNISDLSAIWHEEHEEEHDHGLFDLATKGVQIAVGVVPSAISIGIDVLSRNKTPKQSLHDHIDLVREHSHEHSHNHSPAA